MLLEQITIFAFCITIVKTDLDFGVVSTSPEPSLQESNTNLLKSEIRTLQAQNEKLLQYQEGLRLNAASTNSILSQQTSEINGLKDKMKMLQKQNDRILQDLERLHYSNDQLVRNYRPRSCRDVKDNVTNIYFIKPDSSPNSFAVLCDMQRRGGGWTYLLNRFDGSQDFNLDWNDYKMGFGSPNDEFWLGLDNIHYLTGYETNELLVELVDFNGTVAYAHYDLFGIGSEGEGYSLKLLGGYEGTAGDELDYSVKMKFTTRDKDQDFDGGGNCASHWGGGWWHKSCMNALLTGNYGEGETTSGTHKRMYWYGFRRFHGLKQARMMVRPRRNTSPISLQHEKH